MGCPAKKICRKLAGSALLSDELLVERILTIVVSAVDVPVTPKIRTGVSPGKRNGVQITKIAERCDISQIAFHGRSRECKFRGEAEYQTVKKIKQAIFIRC